MRELPALFNGEMVRAIVAGTKTQTRRPINPEWWRCLDAEDPEDSATALTRCPFGVVGDRLWIRETWAHDAESLEALRILVEDIYGSPCGPYYRADGTHENSGLTWRPSIHMPRWASRITLEVTDVRVQRLQDLSEEDARAEGMPTIGAFACLWNQLYVKSSPWVSNPWVWAVSFKRVPCEGTPLGRSMPRD